MKIVDIARTINPNATHKLIGIRPGEKLHEEMISIDDVPYTFEYEDHFKILAPLDSWHKDQHRILDGQPVADGFRYSSDTNSEWMSAEALQAWIGENDPLADGA